MSTVHKRSQVIDRDTACTPGTNCTAQPRLNQQPSNVVSNIDVDDGKEASLSDSPALVYRPPVNLLPGEEAFFRPSGDPGAHYEVRTIDLIFAEQGGSLLSGEADFDDV